MRTESALLQAAMEDGMILNKKYDLQSIYDIAEPGHIEALDRNDIETVEDWHKSIRAILESRKCGRYKVEYYGDATYALTK